MSQETQKQQKQRVINELNSKWHVNEFKNARLPFSLGFIENTDALDVPAHGEKRAPCPDNGDVEIAETLNEADFYSDQGLYIEDMPIRFPGGGYRIPASIWGNFSDVIQRIMECEESFNLPKNESFIYLTIQQSLVEPGSQQRRGGIHIDGFQKASIVPQRIQHQIAVTNRTPTIFYSGSVDPEKLNVPKKQFFRTLSEEFSMAESYEPSPYELHLLNAYCPHETGIDKDGGLRTFIRFSSSLLPFMGDDNTRNPLFDYEWNEVEKKRFYDRLALKA